MKISHIEIRQLKIPFNVKFTHASASRNETESVLVVANSHGGNTGYGEGCPRSYVTEENIESATAFFDKHKASIQDIENLADLRRWAQAKKEAIDVNPAAWCAIELALLDLLGKEQNQSVEELLSLPLISGSFHYTAVLGTNHYETFKKQFEKYISIGFSDFKVKICGKLDIDLRNLDLLTKHERKHLRIRLDANNLWNTSNEAIEYLHRLDTEFFAIEEPIKTNQYESLRAVSQSTGSKIVLDESFLRCEQFAHIVETPETWIINVRVSKMGGLLRSLKIVQKAMRLKVSIIIGAQVGETSILTRSALTIANSCRNVLLAQEGAFGAYLLEKDIVEKPLVFATGGVLSEYSLVPKQGFGLKCVV